MGELCDSIHLTNDELGAAVNAVELLLQCMELFPDAARHVSPYVSYEQLMAFQEALKSK